MSTMSKASSNKPQSQRPASNELPHLPIKQQEKPIEATAKSVQSVETASAPEATAEAAGIEGTSRVEYMEMSFPLIRGMPESRHIARRADVQLMTMAQATALDALTEGLKDEAALLKNGRPVRCGTDSIKWMLERLSEPEEN